MARPGRSGWSGRPWSLCQGDAQGAQKDSFKAGADQKFPGDPNTATRHAGIDTQMSTAKDIHSTVVELPCPWSFTRSCTDGDTQDKKHHARLDQNQMPPLRWDTQQSPEYATISSRTLVPFASLSAISGTFNSLFKVLFTFPSWYLFAIGLEPIFSFR